MEEPQQTIVDRIEVFRSKESFDMCETEKPRVFDAYDNGSGKLIYIHFEVD